MQNRRECGADFRAIDSPEIYENKRGPHEMPALRGEMLRGLVIGMVIGKNTKPVEKTEAKSKGKKR